VQETRFQKGLYGRPWRRAVQAWLQEDPSRVLCVDCRKEGRVTIGTETDHRIPHRGDPDLFWNRNNWQRLCTMHHSAKTAREVGWGAAK
jgi:5-methylcytosine-specific restriction protein A